MNTANSGSGGSAIAVRFCGGQRYSRLGFSASAARGLPPWASGKTHIATTAKAPNPITSQNSSALPLSFSQKAKPTATSMVNAETTAFTSLGTCALRGLRRPPLVVAQGCGGSFVRAFRATTKALFQVAGVVAVEQMSKEPALEIRGAEEPIGNRERQIHVGFHHQAGIVMGGVVTAQRIDKWDGAHKPVLVHVATEMHELINQIHARGC